MSLLGDAFVGVQDLRSERDGALLEQRSYVPDEQSTFTNTGGWTQGMGTWRGMYSDNVDQAMRLTAVFACLRILSEAVATLPLNLFREADNGDRNQLKRSELPDVFRFPEPGLSKIDYLSQIMLSLLTDGNAYIATIRGALGQLVGLIVLDPDHVKVERKRRRLPDGSLGPLVITYTVGDQELHPILDILHIKGMSRPGRLVGVSPIVYAAETVGVGLNAQRYGDSFFENGALASAVIEAAGDFGDEAARRWRDTWNAGHQGVGNANRLGVLTNGATLKKISITPEEAQFLATRQFTVPDVARVYGVPPHLIADASNSTSWGSGLAEQNSAFGQFSLRAWTERIEESHDRLLARDGMLDICTELDMDAVLRASFKERMEGIQIALESEVMVINEVRRGEGLKPVPWGSQPLRLQRPERPIPVAPADDTAATQAVGGDAPPQPTPRPAPLPAMNGAH